MCVAFLSRREVSVSFVRRDLVGMLTPDFFSHRPLILTPRSPPSAPGPA